MYIHIKLYSASKKRSETQSEALESDKQEYRITVKKYMLEKKYNHLEVEKNNA